MLEQIARKPPYRDLERKGALLEAAIREAIARRGLSDRVCSSGSARCSTLFFGSGPDPRLRVGQARGHASAMPPSSTPCAKRASFLPPAQFEAWFLSTAHGDGDLRRTARAAGESLAAAFGGP